MMANEEHLAILRRGVEVWNEWIKENSHIEADLLENATFIIELA